jgi:hypothetical protein
MIIKSFDPLSDKILSRKTAFNQTALDKTLKLANGEFNTKVSADAKAFFKEVISEDETINGETRAYHTTENSDLFMAEGKCWVAVRDENNRLKFMTCFPIDELKEGV